MADIENSESGDMGFRDDPEFSDYELDSLSERERQRLFDPNNIPANNTAKAPQPITLWDTKTFSAKTNELDKILKHISSKIDKEHENIIMQGMLERKTSQHVFGKKLWEQRYFTLSTHYLNMFHNEHDVEPEQRWRLASVCWIYLCVEKASGTRFNVYCDNDTLQLRGQNLALCQHWVTKLGDAKKRHRNGLRENLQQLAIFEKAMDVYRLQSQMKRVREKDGTKSPKSKKLSDDDADEAEDAKKNDKEKEHKENKPKKPVNIHEKRLQLRAWGIDSDDFATEHSSSRSITFEEKAPLIEEEAEDDEDEDEDNKKSINKNKRSIQPHLTRTVSYAGFLVFARESVEKNAAIVGKKKEYYFTLEGDVLEYKNTPNDNVNIGMLSLDRIESVYRENDSKNEWHITFVNNLIMKWLFESPFNSPESSKKWIGVMKRSSKEARAVKWTIIHEYKWTGGMLKSINNGTLDVERMEKKLIDNKYECIKKLMNCFMPEKWDKNTLSPKDNLINDDSANDDELGIQIKDARERGRENCCRCNIL